VGKELSVHRIQNLLSPDRILHTTQRLVYQRLQNTNLLAASDFSRMLFLERKLGAPLDHPPRLLLLAMNFCSSVTTSSARHQVWMVQRM
jgi:hypothetical protein